VFVSILVHEFGHVLMGRGFGSWGYIVLYGFGGLAVGSNHVRRWWQRVLVSLAGPLAGFLFLAMILAGLLMAARGSLEELIGADVAAELSFWQRLQLTVVLSGGSEIQREVCWNLIWINLIWGLVNLLPVWPLDGGQISREVCQRFSPRNGTRVSLGISVVTAALFAANSLAAHVGQTLIPYLPSGGLFSAVFFAALAYGSYLELQETPTGRPWDHHRQDEPWSRPADWWKRGR